MKKRAWPGWPGSAYTSAIGALLAGALLLVLAAAFASAGYSIYFTNDYLLLTGWFAAVSLVTRGHFGWAALVTFLTAWAKETVGLVPILVALMYGHKKAPAHAVLLRAQHLTTISPTFNWVGIYVLNGDTLELGPYIEAPTAHRRIKVGIGVCGAAVAKQEELNVPDVTASDNHLACSLETQSELVVLVRTRDGRVLGQIDIDSHTPGAFGPEEEAAVK